MKREFVVVDGDNNISWSDKTESGEKFSTFKTARARAEHLAECEPGKVVGIYELAAQAVCSVGKPLTSRAHPREGDYALLD